MGGMSRRKGAVAERAAVNFLRGRGVPADRTSRGADVHGMGDIDGIPGVVIEVKSAKTPAPLAWLRQLDAEMAAADADTGVIWWKPSGVPMGDVPRWIAVHPLAVHQLATRHVPATRWAAECTDHGFATRATATRTVHVSTVAGWMVRASLSGLIDGRPLPGSGRLAVRGDAMSALVVACAVCDAGQQLAVVASARRRGGAEMDARMVCPVCDAEHMVTVCLHVDPDQTRRRAAADWMRSGSETGRA